MNLVINFGLDQAEQLSSCDTAPGNLVFEHILQSKIQIFRIARPHALIPLEEKQTDKQTHRCAYRIILLEQKQRLQTIKI